MAYVCKIYYILGLYLLLFNLPSCAQDTGYYLSAFGDTKAYELAVAVVEEDIGRIEKLIGEDASLLEVANPVNGANVLELSIDTERYRSFEKLLQLGANPNYINPKTNYSILINAIRPFGSQFEWRMDNRYVEVLLKYGADPNYAIEEDFKNGDGYHIMATSPLIEASRLNLDLVKLLIEYGASPNKRLMGNRATGFSAAVQRGKIDIINYYIDSLDIDVRQPMCVVYTKSKNERVEYFIQDYIVNRFLIAKLTGDTMEMERLKQQNEGIEEANEGVWQLIKKLERMGVDFKNYDYKFELRGAKRSG